MPMPKNRDKGRGKGRGRGKIKGKRKDKSKDKFKDEEHPEKMRIVLDLPYDGQFPEEKHLKVDAHIVDSAQVPVVGHEEDYEDYEDGGDYGDYYDGDALPEDLTCFKYKMPCNALPSAQSESGVSWESPYGDCKSYENPVPKFLEAHKMSDYDSFDELRNSLPEHVDEDVTVDDWVDENGWPNFLYCCEDEGLEGNIKAYQICPQCGVCEQP